MVIKNSMIKLIEPRDKFRLKGLYRWYFLRYDVCKEGFAIGMETFHGQWILVDTFFQNGRILYSGHILRVNSHGHFWWILMDTRILFLGEFSWTYFGWILVDTLMVITNGANSGGMGAKPLLSSANTVQCQVRVCGGEALVRISKHCSVSGLG